MEGDKCDTNFVFTSAKNLILFLSSFLRIFIGSSCSSCLAKVAIMTRMTAKKPVKFDPKEFLATIDGGGRKIEAFPKKDTIFGQGDPSDSVFYIQEGKVKLTVVSKSGKEATIGILNEGSFFGEGCLTGQTLRMCSASALTNCTIMRIGLKSMVEVLHREHAFSDIFVAYLLTRNIRYEEDLVDQLFNPSEKRWPGFCYCWLTSVRKKSPKLRFPKSVRRL